jgi:hypothetical protein
MVSDVLSVSSANVVAFRDAIVQFISHGWYQFEFHHKAFTPKGKSSEYAHTQFVSKLVLLHIIVLPSGDIEDHAPQDQGKNARLYQGNVFDIAAGN